jgi:quinoprotein glucose dehydrogenase
MKNILLIFFLFVLFTTKAQKSKPLIIKENQKTAVAKAKELREKIPFKVADGLQVSLWASDSLAPDPICMSIDDLGRVYLTRSNRQKNSEFDIRGHRDWMTESISFKTVEDRRAFLRKTFSPENTLKNGWLKDLNNDGIHDWHDLTIEKDEVWRLEDKNNDGIADISTRVLNDFNSEISDVAGGLLIRKNDAFVGIAPDLWHLKDTNGDGIYDKKTSISHGYGVHIGFGGHGMSGIIEGPDGKIYWNIGDIGANLTSPDGKKLVNPNSGIIARSNPDGSDFEIFATGLRNTHEFVFDEHGNLISSDNDGDHPGESERLVHVVQGSDAGWRSNWQYGKYTDPKNNKYNVWMDEKLFKPRWDGQAAYIIPPIMNFHNGPTGMVYNPGTALGSVWKNKFFLVEFVGNPARSPIWSFGLKPKGASFELDGEQNILNGILPTGIRFGPDGALYVADWINGWDAKDYGRVWKLDVTKETNDLEAIRLETKRLIQLDYSKQSTEMLYSLLLNVDMRIRQKAQFELVNRGRLGLPMLKKAILQRDNQLARIHGIWGIGQLTRTNNALASSLIELLKDNDTEIIAQTAKVLGDAKIISVGKDLISLLQNQNPRVRFYGAEALGKIAYQNAVQPLVEMLKANNDEDLYLRHVAVHALSKIGQIEPILALQKNPSKALRTAAVLVLRKLHNPNIALFLTDEDEYIVTEAARGINDDTSIEFSLPALAATLKETRFTAEPLLRRAINAALRVGGDKELDLLIAFAARTDIKDNIKAEALLALGSWVNPSLTDRVDGRYRGKIQRDAVSIKAKIQPHISNFLKEKNPETQIAMAGLINDLNLTDSKGDLAKIYDETDNSKVKSAILPALNYLKYPEIENYIKKGLEDKEESVRSVSVSLLNDNNVTKENLPILANTIFSKGGIKEQQQLLMVLGKMQADKTKVIYSDLIEKLKNKQLSPSLFLELNESIEKSGLNDLKSQLANLKPSDNVSEEYASSLFGGDKNEGRNIFNYNSVAQCVRCHTAGNATDGGAVGPSLKRIASILTREQILEALVNPSVRLSPGYGSVSLKLTDGQEVFGMLAKETATDLTITTSDAEPLIISIARIAKRENMPSSMPAMGSLLSKREIRDVVEFLSNLK